ncbi:MAG TPA: polymer-forming cytoskeletal protein [Vicinamibacterales bacterium]
MAGEVSTERRQVAWIGQGVTIEGSITSNQDIRIDGRVQGAVEVGQHEVVLGAGSEVKADVNARSVLVGGKIEGDVTATDRIQVQSTGVLIGDVVTPRLIIQDGGMLRGKADVAGTRQNRSNAARPASVAAAPEAMGLARE